MVHCDYSWHGTTPGPQRSWAESRGLLLARDYSWPVTPVSRRRSISKDSWPVTPVSRRRPISKDSWPVTPVSRRRSISKGAYHQRQSLLLQPRQRWYFVAAHDACLLSSTARHESVCCRGCRLRSLLPS